MAKHPQNADGIIKTSSSIELAHLEVSGHFGLVDNSRSGWDFFKLWRGCKAMLVTIACKYRFASSETFSKLKVFGIHCHKSQIDVWEMRPVAPNIYVFLRSSSFRFEEKFEASMVISCSKLVSMLQNCLKESRTVLENLDKEHQLMLVKQQLGSSTPVARLDNIYTTDMRTLKKAGNKKGVATCAPGTE
ncbi:hypothetical protein BDR26DRAFT_362106 [Obelidium mucronatum]|nr:hypothetical protein BDR26DRAFT_362106 [Obelidium mucronatum]